MDQKRFSEREGSDFKFHYSREERLRLSREKRQKKVPVKGLAKLFGGNKMVARFVLFYIALGVTVWVYLTLTENSVSVLNFHYPKHRSVRIRLIHTLHRHGFNLAFRNNDMGDWEISGFSMSNRIWYFQTNFNQSLAREEFVGFFISAPLAVSNLKDMDFKLNSMSGHSDK